MQFDGSFCSVKNPALVPVVLITRLISIVLWRVMWNSYANNCIYRQMKESIVDQIKHSKAGFYVRRSSLQSGRILTSTVLYLPFKHLSVKNCWKKQQLGNSCGA
jgi:hypothetical protein